MRLALPGSQRVRVAEGVQRVLGGLGLGQHEMSERGRGGERGARGQKFELGSGRERPGVEQRTHIRTEAQVSNTAQLQARRDAFINRLIAAMQEMGMSQQQLARELQRYGLKASVSTVNGWVKHKRLPTGDYMLVLPHVLRKNGHYLLTGEEPPPAAAEARQVVGDVVDFAARLAARYGVRRPSPLPGANADALEAARDAVRRLEEILGLEPQSTAASPRPARAKPRADSA